jgi:hypothetical protein
MRRAVIAAVTTGLLLAATTPLVAQVAPQPGPQPGDGATVESMMTALYATVTRTRGQNFDWPRMRALFLPGAQLVPATQPATDSVRRYSVEAFVSMIDASWARSAPIGSDGDQGFYEREINLVKEEYGDVAIAFSTYEKGVQTAGAPRYRGINAIQLVKSRGRWWITSMSWDEEAGAGPLPPRYAGAPR